MFEGINVAQGSKYYSLGDEAWKKEAAVPVKHEILIFK